MERPSHAGLRHLALNVRDLAAMKRFYVDLIIHHPPIATKA
jgi:catechol 2,3-dioxygenase-like lactoylglutathione lyase family enzyme